MAQRITSTAVNWPVVIEKFLPEERYKLYALKSVIDKYIREVAARPSELPKINWDFYKTRITAPGVVESFQKSYESLKIPYPSDQGVIAEVEKYNNSFMKKCDAKFAKMKTEIKTFKEELAELEKIMPYKDMTMEEFYLARPDLKYDKNNPTLWPPHLQNTENNKSE